jgi:acyl-CoA dehydrogenase
MLEIEKSPWMNEELEILRASARKFYEREFLSQDETWRKQGYVDRDAWRKAGEAGLLCASIPEAYGGGGGTFAHEAVINEEQLRLGITSFGNSVHSGMVAHYINAYGSDEQKNRWLPKMASGDLVGGIAMTEPGTGSDLQGVKTTAKLNGNEYVVNGQKTFITNGQSCNLIIVVAKTDPAAGAKGTSLVVVETDEVDGFRRGRNLAKIGQKGQDTSELFFDDVRVPTANLLGAQQGLGFGQLMNQLPQERLIIALLGVSAMEAALAGTVEYVKERKAFGQRLLDFQNTRFKLAEQKSIAVIARVFVDRCIELHLKGQLDAITAAMAKWWCTQMQCDLVDECLQLHGGYGYMLEYPIARFYADARVQKIYGGTNEIMKELIARTL